MTLRLPPGSPPWLEEIVLALAGHADEQPRVMSATARDIGSNESKVRFLAAQACPFVYTQTQHDGASGGGADYDDTDPLSTLALVDCRQDRQQEVTLSRDGTNRYYVFLIPAIEIGGNKLKFDGSEADDHVLILDLGV